MRTPLQSWKQTHTLVPTPAGSQHQGQAGCTLQSQHYPNEQGISEEKQRKKGHKE